MQFEKVKSPDEGIHVYREVNGHGSQEREERSMLLPIDQCHVRRAQFRADAFSCAINLFCVGMGIVIGLLLRGGK